MSKQENYQPAVVLHGGAGTLHRDRAEKKVPIMSEARDVAWQILQADGSAEEAVIAAVRLMEASEFFNAGYGSYPNANGIVLQDIGLMRGDLNFVSLLNVRRLIHPSAVALDMLKDGRTILSVWTKELMDKVDASTSEIKERYGWVENHGSLLAPSVIEMLKADEAEFSSSGSVHGTVGCVARDRRGNLAACTCTGGVNVKANGRIGDSPIIGSGVFADNSICALSTTGHGESFLKSQISSFIIGRLREFSRRNQVYSELDLQQIMREEFSELDRKCPKRGGGMIIIPAVGRPVYHFNSEMLSVAYKFQVGSQVTSEAYIADRVSA